MPATHPDGARIQAWSRLPHRRENDRLDRRRSRKSTHGRDPAGPLVRLVGTTTQEVNVQNNNMVMYSIGALFLLLCAVADSGYGQVVTLPDIDTSEFPNGIVSLPPGTPSVFTDVFSKYTKVLATNGKPIHFLIQDEWPEDEIIKVRNVMKHMLTDFPYSKYGRNKAAVANAMGTEKRRCFCSTAPRRQEKRGKVRSVVQPTSSCSLCGRRKLPSRALKIT